MSRYNLASSYLIMPIVDLEPRPPEWVGNILGSNASKISISPHVQATASGALALLTTSIAQAADMPPDTLRSEVALAYRRLGARTALLIGGTASIVGEQSLHEGDVDAQLRETLRNIAALARLVDLRVYAIDDDVARVVRCQLAPRCPNAQRIEIVRARMCRPELLLEIEALAEI